MLVLSLTLTGIVIIHLGQLFYPVKPYHFHIADMGSDVTMEYRTLGKRVVM